MKKMRKHPDGSMYPDIAPFNEKWPLATDEEMAAYQDSLPSTNKDAEEVPAAIKMEVTPNAPQEEQKEEAPADPDDCDSLEDALSMVEDMTSNECDAYAAKLEMEPFKARVKVGDKRTAIVAKMEEMAAANK